MEKGVEKEEDKQKRRNEMKRGSSYSSCPHSQSEGVEAAGEEGSVLHPKKTKIQEDVMKWNSYDQKEFLKLKNMIAEIKI